MNLLRQRRYRRYLVLSGLLIAGVVAASGLIVGDFIERLVLDDEEAQTVEVVQNQARQHLTPADFAGADGSPAFQGFLDGLPRVFRIKAFDPSGRIVWSNERRLIGQMFPDNPYLKRALGGKPTTVLEAPTRAEHVYERTKRYIAEAYVPITLPGAAGVIGIVETYKDATETMADIGAMQRRIWTAAGGIGLLLYVALAAVVYGASSGEQRAIHLLEEQNRELRLLQQFSQSLLRPLDVAGVADRIVHSAAESVGFVRAAIYRASDGAPGPLAVWPAAARVAVPDAGVSAEAVALRRAVVRDTTVAVPLLTAAQGAYLFVGEATSAEAAARAATARPLEIMLQGAAIALANAAMVDEIRAAHERLAAILAGIADEMIIIDRDMRVVWRNAAAAGTARREVGRPCFEAMGDPRMCAECPAARTLASGRVERGVRAHVLAGGETRYLDLVTAPMRDAAGQVYQVLEVARDITDLVQMEERLKQTNQALLDTQTRLIEKERLAAAGEVVVGLHHSILNPLTGILGALQVIGASSAADATVRHAVVEAQAEAKKIEQLVRRLATLRSASGTPYVGSTTMLDLAAGDRDEPV